jgi:hypothetical protein
MNCSIEDIMRPTEYAVIKRLLFARAEYDPCFNLGTANNMITEACVSAFDGLDVTDRRHISEASQSLRDHASNLGEKGALILLAAVAPYVGEDN